MVASCAMKHVRVVACTAFAKGALDSVTAKEGASALGVELVSEELTIERASDALRKLELPFTPDLMDRSLWCLYSTAARMAHDEGAKVILLGQLADEQFGGYAKYAEALKTGGEDSARMMMQADFRDYALRGRLRDVGACAPWAEPRLPFEANDLVELASSLPVSFKIRNGVRKAVLRKAATILGVPGVQAGAAKKAAQYSSGIQKLVASLPF